MRHGNPWGLTPAQQRVIVQIVCGKSDARKVVASELGISTQTVDSHIIDIKARMGAPTITKAALMWAQWSMQFGMPAKDPSG